MQDRLGKLIQEGQKNLAMIEYMRKELLQARKKQDELEEKLNEKDQEVSGNTTSPVTDFVKNCNEREKLLQAKKRLEEKLNEKDTTSGPKKVDVKIHFVDAKSTVHLFSQVGHKLALPSSTQPFLTNY